MWAVSDSYTDSLGQSYTRALLADAYEGGTLVERDLPIVAGGITLDADADIRASGTLTVARSETGLDPYRTDLQIKWGHVYSNGAIEWIPLGLFRVTGAEVPTGPKEPVVAEIADHGSLVATGGFLRPFKISRQTDVTEAIRQLLVDALPGITVVDQSSNRETVGQRMVFDENRWDAINALADSVDCDVYFDRLGRCVIGERAAGLTPDWRVTSGQDGTMVAAPVRLTRENVYNGIVCTGESSGQGGTARATATDQNPNSETYWDGPFGRSVLSLTDPAWNTTVKAQRAANRRLPRYVGRKRAAQITCLPNVALDPWDTIAVTWPSGLAEDHVVAQVGIPFDLGGAFTITTRLKQT